MLMTYLAFRKRTHSVKSLFPVVTGYFFFGQAQEAGCVIVENAGLLLESQEIGALNCRPDRCAVYDDPDFAPILAVQQDRQKRERDKFLAVVCSDNPYTTVWQPEDGTCERFTTESGIRLNLTIATGRKRPSETSFS